MTTETTKSNTNILSRAKKAIARRIDIANLILIVTLGVLLLLDINRGWFSKFGAGNFDIFISAAITGLVAGIAIVIPLRIQKHTATRTLSMVVSSELYRNLSELEYANQELKKDYNQQPPFAGVASPKDRQTMEMSKIMGMAVRLDAALENTGYKGMMSSRIIADIDQELAQKIIEAYSGIASARQTAKHFADFFEKLLDAESDGVNAAFTEHSRQHQVDKAIRRVGEDVCIAIGQINKAVNTLNKVVRKHGNKFEPVYRDQLLKKYACDNNQANTPSS